ncbi:hypothetical protein AVEN_201076-1 [Araneus ventricosus]|uniref:Uncharacterized protein n=1 Tax=Araneus ventricosus TaxID=182803 RepID=A0A4Y2PRU3_ARAVE|nr:hypothetical protein AVEN_200606-1 [Araneus ventricosus]GBN53899.1 hypothetical protein AVEN_201076-1 [Araneus ventricosus]
MEALKNIDLKFKDLNVRKDIKAVNTQTDDQVSISVRNENRGTQIEVTSKEQFSQTQSSVKTPPLLNSVITTDDYVIRTFAEVDKNKQSLTATKAEDPTVLLNSKDSSKNGGISVKEILLSNFSCFEAKIKNVRTIRNNRFAITCNREEDLEQIINKINGTESLSNSIAYKKPKRKHPSIILYNIPNWEDEVSIQNVLKVYSGKK